MKVLFSFKKHYRTILVFCALSITIAILFFALSACDDNGADELPIEIVSSNYEFSVDLSPKGKTEFYFTPKFSGDYVVTKYARDLQKCRSRFGFSGICERFFGLF